MPVSSSSHEEKHSEEEQARDAASVRVRDWLMPMIRSCKAVYRQPVGEWNKMIVEGFQYSNRNRCKAKLGSQRVLCNLRANDSDGSEIPIPELSV